MAESCTSCRKAPPEVTLKHCAKCKTARYCSRDCQKADWKAHKKVCGSIGGSAGDLDPPMAGQMLSPPKGLDKPIAMPFTRLENGTWLYDRPPTDVYRLLLEAYRLRMEDNYTMEGDVDADSLYGGAPSGLPGFRRFLRLAGSRPGLLPPWWNAESQRECERFGMDETQFQDLRCAVEKSDIIEHYGDARFPMQLRMFAEAVYRRGPGGQSGAAMRGLMVAMEQGTVPTGSVATTMDNRTGNTSSVRSGGRGQ
jgi:splicing suppressor protein 51